ncbi:MAG: hypothetical protein JW808_05935 [Victivallales bacterium]|nr:hypothetical protein [Victivallales bacterium]
MPRVICADADAPLKAALDSAAKGDVSGLISRSGELFADDIDDQTMQKVYVLLALGYTLEGNDDAAERCAGLLDLFPEEFDSTPSAAIIGFLAGKVKEKDLVVKASSAPDDWRAVASVARYLDGVRSKKGIRELYSVTQGYKDAIARLPLDSWALVWDKRLPKWHGYIQAGRGEAEDLEPLIAANRPAMPKEQQDDSDKHAATINAIISLYLQNEPEKAKKSAMAAKAAIASKDDPFHVILDYLSGTPMEPALMAETISGSAVNWALGTVAVFARSLSDSEKPDKQKLYFCIDNFEANFTLLSKNPEVAQWKQSVEKWRKWCDSGFKADACVSGEPLLLARSLKAGDGGKRREDFKDITTVLPDEFKEGRSERYAGRPKPISLDFDDKAFEQYLSSLPENLREGEKLRYSIIKGLKHHMILVMERTPFPNGLITKRGKRNGVVYMANVNVLRLKRSQKSKKGESYKWEDLSFRQYPAFIEYFAKRRLAVSGAGQVSREEQMQGAANEYLGLAVLCDWFGQYEDALKYANEAVNTHPDSIKNISRIMLD